MVQSCLRIRWVGIESVEVLIILSTYWSGLFMCIEHRQYNDAYLLGFEVFSEGL